MSNEMKDLLNDFDVKRIKKGDILQGEVIDVNDKEVSVNINYAFDGLIKKEEFARNEVTLTEVVKSGDKISVYVLSPNDGDGYVILSKVRADEIVDRDEIKAAFKAEKTINVTVKEEVKGGLVAYFKSIRVFIPASLASRNRIELASLIGKTIEVQLTEVDFKNRRVVASRRVLEEAAYNEKKKALWETVKSGEKREGTVRKIIKAGAIVDIGGVSGLIHINDLAWGRVRRVEDVVNVGDKVTVFVGEVDTINERVSLILKDKEQDPWAVNAPTLQVGKVYTGKVTKFLQFGAIVELFPAVDGLVHISEITDENIAKPEDVLKRGQEVKVKVLDVNLANKRISLSIKEATEKSKEYLQYNDNEDGVSLGDLFKDFKFE